MKVVLLVVMLTTCAASPQDLSGKMFSFPQQTNTAHVKLNTSRQNFSAVTVCLRSITDLRRDHIIFSLATPSADNGFQLLKHDLYDSISLFRGSNAASFPEQDYKLNVWHSICSTWDSESQLVQLWLDGKPSIKKLVSTGTKFRGNTIIILGQERDFYDGGFDFPLSFIGMISDVHMWDYVISHCEIHNYVNELNFSPGNVLNWKALEFQIIDRVMIEDKQRTCY